MTIRDDLIAAKALIDTPEKWWKGPAIGPAGEMCAVRACEKAVGLPPMGMHDDPYGRAYEMFIALNGKTPRGFVVSTYNDMPDTAHADIMAVFDRAIKALEP